MDRHGNVIDALVDRGVAVSRDFLPMAAVAALAQEARALYADGGFRQGGVGRGGGRTLASDIRGDQVRWLDEAAATPPQAVFWQALHALMAELNAALYLGLAEFEGHYAAFPPGAHYLKHLDRFAESDARVISAVLYLNDGWTAGLGGALRLYGEGGWEDVLPEAGTLVVFRSDSVYHEVLPASRLRFSLTGWFRRRGASLLETIAAAGAGRDAA
ncbi:MAG TPA: 2OG-Fe(II) oxygenase [Pelomicrobium sp.]|nr:2OG-Fe(II) oxygenase [Pelomicrobium sp.]